MKVEHGLNEWEVVEAITSSARRRVQRATTYEAFILRPFPSWATNLTTVGVGVVLHVHLKVVTIIDGFDD